MTSPDTPSAVPTPPTVHVVRVVLAISAIAIAARFSVPVPGSDVPQSLQTLAVVLVGFFLGSRGGAIALVGYLIVGAIGLPVFADGAAGWDRLVGPTAGYLVGFVAGAWMAGLHRDRGAPAGGVGVFGIAVLGHVVILGLGWVWLGRTIGYPEAYSDGVAPFLGGGVWKSVAAALVAAVWLRVRADPAESHPS